VIVLAVGKVGQRPSILGRDRYPPAVTIRRAAENPPGRLVN
jgi:hypothetical protein